MNKKLPQITISIARGTDRGEVTSDLNSLSVGLGLFLAWFFLALLSTGCIHAFSEGAPEMFPVPGELVPLLNLAALLACAVFLLVAAFTNQRLLAFYVSRPAPVAATVLAVAGTALLCVPGGGALGAAVTVGSGVLLGLAGALALVLWGTAFAHHSFTTIVLNTVLAIALALAIAIVLIHWVPAPASYFIVGLLPVVSFHLLWRSMPAPYYARHEAPVFSPLGRHHIPFGIRLGVPTLLFGVPFGALQAVCLGAILPSDSIAMQLCVFAAAVIALLLIVIVVMLSKSVSHWDIVFRCVVPVIALGLFALTGLAGPNSLLCAFLAVCGFVCFEAVMWILFADLSQEFALSPIFVFGLGNSFLLLGVLGATLAIHPLFGEPTSVEALAGAVPGLLLALVMGYASLPRQREIATLMHSVRRTAPSAAQLAASAPEHDQATEDAVAIAVAEALAEAPRKAADEAASTDAEDASQARGRFQARCDDVARTYLLSRRETEVMRLLAKGHNAAFIQEKLCISKSTAKTHINHIYKKLDIHTQQELLNLMEQGKGPESAARPATGPDSGRDGRDGQRRAASSIFGER